MYFSETFLNSFYLLATCSFSLKGSCFSHPSTDKGLLHYQVSRSEIFSIPFFFPFTITQFVFFFLKHL